VRAVTIPDQRRGAVSMHPTARKYPRYTQQMRAPMWPVTACLAGFMPRVPMRVVPRGRGKTAALPAVRDVPLAHLPRAAAKVQP
jgi:hypothetical protein